MSKLSLSNVQISINGLDLGAATWTVIEHTVDEVDVTAFGGPRKTIPGFASTSIAIETNANEARLLEAANRTRAIDGASPKVKAALEALFEMDDAAREQGKEAIASVRVEDDQPVFDVRLTELE